MYGYVYRRDLDNTLEIESQYLYDDESTLENLKPLYIANIFLDKYGAISSFSSMSLNKLVYLFYCYNLIYQTCHIGEKPEIWRYGPVMRSLYHAFKDYGMYRISEPVIPPFSNFIKCENKLVNQLVDWIYNKYGKLSAQELSSICHCEDSPWAITAKKHNYRVKAGTTVPDSLIKEYYQKELHKIN